MAAGHRPFAGSCGDTPRSCILRSQDHRKRKIASKQAGEQQRHKREQRRNDPERRPFRAGPAEPWSGGGSRAEAIGGPDVGCRGRRHRAGARGVRVANREVVQGLTGRIWAAVWLRPARALLPAPGAPQHCTAVRMTSSAPGWPRAHPRRARVAAQAVAAGRRRPELPTTTTRRTRPNQAAVLALGSLSGAPLLPPPPLAASCSRAVEQHLSISDLQHGHLGWRSQAGRGEVHQQVPAGGAFCFCTRLR